MSFKQLIEILLSNIQNEILCAMDIVRTANRLKIVFLFAAPQSG